MLSPLVKSEPEDNMKDNCNPAPLSLLITPDVSPSKVIVFLSQVSAELTVFWWVLAAITLWGLAQNFKLATAKLVNLVF